VLCAIRTRVYNALGILASCIRFSPQVVSPCQLSSTSCKLLSHHVRIRDICCQKLRFFNGRDLCLLLHAQRVRTRSASCQAENTIAHSDFMISVTGRAHGVTTIQAYKYFARYSQDDGLPIKAVVPLIFRMALSLLTCTRSVLYGKSSARYL